MSDEEAPLSLAERRRKFEAAVNVTPATSPASTASSTSSRYKSPLRAATSLPTTALTIGSTEPHHPSPSRHRSLTLSDEFESISIDNTSEILRSLNNSPSPSNSTLTPKPGAGKMPPKLPKRHPTMPSNYRASTLSTVPVRNPLITEIQKQRPVDPRSKERYEGLWDFLYPHAVEAGIIGKDTTYKPWKRGSDVREINEGHGEERISGAFVKKLWERSRLSRDELYQIMLKVDLDKSGGLDKASFVEGLWLIDEALRRRAAK